MKRTKFLIDINSGAIVEPFASWEYNNRTFLKFTDLFTNKIIRVSYKHDGKSKFSKLMYNRHSIKPLVLISGNCIRKVRCVSFGGVDYNNIYFDVHVYSKKALEKMKGTHPECFL